MKTSYKLAIIAIAVIFIAWCAYTIYKNSQPQPKKAIELNEVKKEIDQNSPQPTQQPETTPTNTEPQTTQKSVTQPTEQPQVAEVVPVQQTGGVENGVEISEPVANPPSVTVTIYGDAGQKEQAERNLTR